MEIMLDLETMSLSEDAAIVSIGAVRFSLTGEEPDWQDAFYRVVNLKSAQKAGGRVDAETVMWWMQQNDAARNALLSDDAVLIDVALKEFSAWVRQKPLLGIWGNGAGYDNVVLKNAYGRSPYTPPWSYTQNCCYRTMAARSNIPREQFRVGTHHHALDDAVTQARHLRAIWAIK